MRRLIWVHRLCTRTQTSDHQGTGCDGEALARGSDDDEGNLNRVDSAGGYRGGDRSCVVVDGRVRECKNIEHCIICIPEVNT